MSLGPAPQRLTVEVDQARRLVGSQFPQWAGLPVRPVANGGWDNLTFHLGSEMSLRLPSAAEYAQAVEKEHRWLPFFAGRLPRPVPVPLALGAPGEGYPFPWSVYRWLDGRRARAAEIADPVRFALDLAEFLAALQEIDPAEGPAPGTHNWFRGGPLTVFDGLATDALAVLDGIIDVGLAREIWGQALEVPWDGSVRWFHGDVAPGNLLLRDGKLGAVIDFGTCGVGDPSCDYAVAWTLLTSAGREAFRRRLGIDEDSWLRGRGWALWKSLSTCANSLDETGRPAPDTLHDLNEIFTDHRA
ncbi:aminoglycoside phosphotransferase [Paractinoplanes abujensis]|uniref:Aminoglycoside phosphotransferase (APT) family kinase protein n=1 Tax=Paractinoplanes abujensis TaxID=882441 RepID=A0A7W7CWF9_9ACTN|nr:aminoglycoside phosphotransferase family protein [Actinoplanes abujensis]MBB4694281.1 aminoglycoside phosphotransferase (APT) family kinase protein [Actinoplanes abujensis]GID20506.1 aminoglycoside phosphotransferase [Actinoplanes abujensis]